MPGIAPWARPHGYFRQKEIPARFEARGLLSGPNTHRRSLDATAAMETQLMPVIEGAPIPLAAQSVCVHGDTAGAVSMAQVIRRWLSAAGIGVAPFLQPWPAMTPCPKNIRSHGAACGPARNAPGPGQSSPRMPATALPLSKARPEMGRDGSRLQPHCRTQPACRIRRVHQPGHPCPRASAGQGVCGRAVPAAGGSCHEGALPGRACRIGFPAPMAGDP